MWSWVRHGGKKGRWNDLWIKWKTKDQLRYYHAFSQRELKGLLDPNVWTIESIYKSRFNYNVVARKK